ncbi:MAG TPA: amino acid permease [Nocardioides sp.]|uniref:amino acid permease n=1 Tax=uncultured Nocardioides sp. TaxID=198441 RepID=UPI000EECEE9C|nr:amino acid permease [uncultured Nocardioides sp.]HCB07673.1 amino acid permease [Nocardioides sp.]HRD61124.1 amino acid permease [Nocardioides sp.]HRI96946.1 amino acid permease [Nocardioides sp.]HRK46851.1 amino acid permease [Nocardioides sp.]
MSLLRTKSIEQSIEDTEEPEHKLRKDLGALDLVVFGVGVTIGAGIFVLTGTVAATNSGPALALSFLIAAIACALAALCYAEFASTVPVAGSAYTFSYATLGELVAWIIGWDLVLEFTIGAAALSVGFSGYLQSLLDGTALEIPESIGSASGGAIDLPAVVIALLVMVMLVRGTKFSSRVNQIVVAIKLAVVAAVIVVGFAHVSPSNWKPFIPESQPVPEGGGGFAQTPLITTLLGIEPAVYGLAGVIAGAAIVFFAFIGFDVVATTAEEAHSPQRDVPIGILGSLVIVTVLYAAVSLVVTGLQNYTEIDPEDAAPLATAFKAVGVDWMGDLISVGACIGLVVVAMILMLGQTRVAFAMGRDGLLPRWLSKVHPTYGTPYRITLITGVVVAVIAGFVDLTTLADLVNIGTLFAFILVSIGVVILRRTRPDLPRAFRVPFAPVVATLATLMCLYLMLNLKGDTWVRFLIWMALGLVVYFAYGRRHSRLETHRTA